eukprot:COSAG02_NODE_392_length_23227_cov_30.763620_9_plen_56_part_00
MMRTWLSAPPRACVIAELTGWLSGWVTDRLTGTTLAALRCTAERTAGHVDCAPTT